MTTKNIFESVFAVFLLFLTACAGPEKPEVSVSREIILEADKIPRNFSKIANLAKRWEISESETGKYSGEELEALFEAANTLASHFQEESRALSAEKILREILRRKPYKEGDYKTAYKIKRTYRAFVRARMFEKAKKLAGEFPGVNFPYIPEMIIENSPEKAGRWRIYRVSGDFQKAELGYYPLGDGVKMVLIILTGCSVTEHAMKEIMKDEDLAPVFRKRGLLLTNVFDAEGVTLWQNQFNFKDVYIARKASDFPGLDFNFSPNFHLLKNGEAIWKREGWGREALEEIKEKLKEEGLI